MAVSLQQTIRYRKLIYTTLILGLFLVSLLHRQFVILPQAEKLQLREVDRGEVEFTGAAKRLVLTGSRGLAVTFLWNDVIKKQEKHRWNEVEMLVDSITELQPHFITPWLFQSWNLAFNIAVENERPRDKYYYVARGLERLAAGERRNAVPGNPDLRYHMGMYLQLKLGTSDEKMTMRSLLDLSAMDPVERDPAQFRGSGGQINDKRFHEFCRAYPRLVRRLRDQLGYNAADVINFLADSRDVPTRFSDKRVPGEGGKERSELKNKTEQWPVLPPQKPQRYAWPGDWPDATQPDFGLTRDSFDIYLLTRTWHIYSQESVPPPNPHPYALENPQPDKRNERMPRRPALILFRAHPARAQAYIAETLQEEGWFDDQGWLIKDWFKDKEFDNLEKRVVGDQLKYHSGKAWEKAFKFYEKYGTENGLYLSARQRKDLEKLAAQVRDDKRTRLPPPKRPNVGPDLKEAFFAFDKLAGNRRSRDLTRFDAFFAETRAKSTPPAVAALKLFAMAEPFRQKPAPVIFEYYERNAKNQLEEKAAPLLEVYDRAVELWLGVLLDSPLLRSDVVAQEDSYDLQLKYLRYFQKEKLDDFLKPIARGMCQWALPMHPGLAGPTVLRREILLDDVMARMKYIRDFRGPFDMVRTIQHPGLDDEAERELKMILTGLSTAGKPWLALHPSLQPFQLSFTTTRDAPVVGWWRPLIAPEAVATVRNRHRGLQPINPKGQPHPPLTPP